MLLPLRILSARRSAHALSVLFLACCGAESGAGGHDGQESGFGPEEGSPDTGASDFTANPAIIAIPPSPQDTSGNPAAGLDYLKNGGFIGAGIPVEIYLQLSPPAPENLLQRTGEAAEIDPSFNVFDVEEAGQSVRVAGGTTCFGCHSSSIDGQFIPGLGNAFVDATATGRYLPLLDTIDGLVTRKYGADGPEHTVFARFMRGALATVPGAIPPFRGVSNAFLIEDSAAAYRDPATLEWLDEPRWTTLEKPDAPPHAGSDVPAWWLLKKKNGLYYNGMGRGDFRRLLMQVSVVATSGAAQNEEILTHFADVYAWILTLTPPVFPRPVDRSLLTQGESVFQLNCAKCHGTYGDGGVYPNLLVGVSEVGTDPLYAEQFTVPGRLTDWFDESWYAGDGGAYAEPTVAYVAPPLDGVWATAPYLHTGAVPTLAALLDSALRPVLWSRDFGSDAYDYENVGWPFEVEPMGGESSVFDTRVPGYGAGGHVFGDSLSRGDRAALLEYLKTL